MRVLVFESNLMWSSKIGQSLRNLGHEPVLMHSIPEADPGAKVAIVNLSQTSPDLHELVDSLRAFGVATIGHAGHKEKALHELGRSIGVDMLATNSELTFRIESLVSEASERLG
jgi:hypothetical protein